MTDPLSIYRPARLLDAGPVLLIGLLGAVWITPSGEPAAPPFIRSAIAQQTFAWSLPQVRALIGQVEGARRHGLDPARYGLAALRAELELCEQLWNTPGSRQLDALARTAALALANDYRRTAPGSVPVRGDELDAALGQGRVGAWLAAMAPDGRRAS